METVNHSERAHSELGASSAHRWMACPASIKLSQQVPEETRDNTFAAEGTCAHELAEKALLEDKKCREYIGETFEGFTVTEEMADFTQTYVDYVCKQGEGEFKDTIIEERFDLSFIAEGMFGTNDACISEFMGTLEIIDLKYGKGVEVFPEDNKQLLYYALGAAQGGDYETVKLTIVQPRVENPIKSIEYPIERLETFKNELIKAVESTREANPSFATGSHCRFCRAKAICPSQREQAQSVARVAFNEPVVVDEGSLPDPHKLTYEELDRILSASAQIEDWLKSVRSYVQNSMERGEKIPNYKLVAKRATRKYVNEKEVVEAFEQTFGDKIYQKPKLLGVPAMEKLVGKKELQEYVCKPETGVTLAHETDKRPAVNVPTITDVFSSESVDDDNDFNNMTF